MFRSSIVLTVFYLFVFVSALQGQCLVKADISLSQGGITEALLNSTSSVLSPGTNITAYRWKVNGIDVGSIDHHYLDYQVPVGLNEVCLQLKAFNSITGDSCLDEYCNIYTSTSAMPYPVLQFSGSGNTVNLFGNVIGGNPFAFTSFGLDPGDGSNPYSTQQANHTYSVPGKYNVSLYVNQPPMPFANIDRKVHVNDGVNNLENLNNLNIVYPTCDSVSGLIQTTPAFFNAYAADGNYFTSFVSEFTGTYFTQGNSFGGRYFVPGQSMVNVHFFDSGNVHVQYFYPVFIDDDCIVPPDTLTGYVWEDVDADGIKDSTESFLSNKTISAFNYSVKTDTAGTYSLLLPHASAVVSLDVGNGISTVPSNGNYGPLRFMNGQKHSGFNFGVSPVSVSLCGSVFIDYNLDNLYSAGIDVAVQQATIKFHHQALNKDYYTGVDANGQYCLSLPPGNYVIKASTIGIDSVICLPDSIVLNAMNGTYNNNNFAIHSNYPGLDLSVQIMSTTSVRPGFGVSYSMRVNNTGIDSSQAILILNYDAHLIPGTISPVNGVVNTTSHTITWPIISVLPGSLSFFDAHFTVDGSTPLGTNLLNLASINPAGTLMDRFTGNNLSLLSQRVVGSFDPNDKLVLPKGSGITGNIAPGTQLNYRINFQNTGTASAISVVVQDELSPNLDLSTFQIGRCSHLNSFSINGRTATWIFNNINLPDSNANEALSHGFIEYSARPISGLPDGTQIENQAAIYFDFNVPVITNTVLNTIQSVTAGTQTIDNRSVPFFYPNPSNGYFTIVNRGSELMHGECRLVDLCGQLIGIQEICLSAGEAFNWQLYDIRSGTYILLLPGYKPSLISIVR